MAADDAARVTTSVGTDGDGRTMIVLAGEIDLTTVPAVRSAITDAVSRSAEIVFDMSAVDFMDSSGIAVLVEAGSPSGWVVIRRPSLAVRRVIEATGLADVLRMEP